MLKIQFIILGWHYNPISYQEGLVELIKNNPNVDINVYFVCKKEPTQFVKDNFKYKVYDNIGLEWKGYTDGFFDLDLDDDTICFFTHDDIEVLDWNFLPIIIDKLNSGIKLMGNGSNPQFYLDPNAIITPNNTDEPFPYGSKYTWKEVATNKEYFTEPGLCKNLRASFMSMKAKTFRDMKGLEWIADPYDGASGNLLWANISVNLSGYKWTKLYGENSIDFLSNTYAISPYINELERGK
jgi:hypothetical protein|tara:strand:- start:6639 stop:7355 length:717 start_codon:yes stop_codon:yes gene_type:complete